VTLDAIFETHYLFTAFRALTLSRLGSNLISFLRLLLEIPKCETNGNDTAQEQENLKSTHIYLLRASISG
jgi:hypothetical protein